MWIGVSRTINKVESRESNFASPGIIIASQVLQWPSVGSGRGYHQPQPLGGWGGFSLAFPWPIHGWAPEASIKSRDSRESSPFAWSLCSVERIGSGNFPIPSRHRSPPEEPPNNRLRNAGSCDNNAG